MFDKLIENFPKILRALTFARVALVAILAILFTVLYITFDARQTIIEAIKVVSIGNPGRNAVMGNPETVKQIKGIVNRSMLITGLQLVSTDFRSNTRSTTYFFSDQPGLQTSVDVAVTERVAPTPIFLTAPVNATPEQSAYVQMSNQRVIEIMSANFVCYDTATTLLARMAPGIVSLAPVICSMSIPPYSGKFSGYMNLMLTRQPTDDEKQMLHDAARGLASDIFDREVAR